MTYLLGSSVEDVSVSGAQATAQPLCVEWLEEIRAAHANYPAPLLCIPKQTRDIN